MMAGVPADEKQVAKCKVQMDASLDQVENIFLKNQVGPTLHNCIVWPPCTLVWVAHHEAFY